MTTVRCATTAIACGETTTRPQFGSVGMGSAVLPPISSFSLSARSIASDGRESGAARSIIPANVWQQTKRNPRSQRRDPPVFQSTLPLTAGKHQKSHDGKQLTAVRKSEAGQLPLAFCPDNRSNSLQERCMVQQQHLSMVVSGAALPPDMDPASSEGRFLLDVQEQIVEGDQVIIIHPAIPFDPCWFQSLCDQSVESVRCRSRC